MKKLLFLFVFALGVSSSGYSQCVPDTNITHNVSGIYPDSATGLPHAVVGVPYLTDMQFSIPTDTMYAGQPAVLDSIRITYMTGLPAGFTYTCTPPNCIFPGGATSCIQITGTAPTSGMVGSYPIVVGLRVSGRLYGIIAQQIDTSNSNYTIVIDNNTAIATLVPTAFQVSQNKPNPFHGKTEITVSGPTSEELKIKVCDLLGNVLRNETAIVPKGISSIYLTSDELSPGIYLYTITNGRSSVTRRMIVSGN
ncbi:MAG TPA: T9SS type A sorting domain-containing protein [Bacteroidia bacterium]|nr:T9SS type A sorting domain-containing protein [Bacteroidia bacterium]